MEHLHIYIFDFQTNEDIEDAVDVALEMNWIFASDEEAIAAYNKRISSGHYTYDEDYKQTGVWKIKVGLEKIG